MDSKEIINLIPLDKETQELTQKIVDEKDLETLKDLTHLFNLSQAKRNVLRVVKLNSLLDKVSDQMIERFEKYPDNFSSSDLLNYLQVTQNAIDRANKSLNLIDETPVIQLNQVNINVTEEPLDRESRSRIADAVQAILRKSKELEIEPEIIDVNNTDETIEPEEVQVDVKLLKEEEE